MATFLIAEDNQLCSKLLRHQLSGLGFVNVDSAFNGLEAVALASRHRYTIILMDCQMPLMNGYEAAQNIRAMPLHSSTPIVALTGDSSSENGEKCRSSGMSMIFSKPITKKEWSVIIDLVKKHAAASMKF